MNLPEPNECLKAGERYHFYTREHADEALTESQKGPPEIESVLVRYRGINIISEDAGSKMVWNSVFGDFSTLSAALDAVDAS